MADNTCPKCRSPIVDPHAACPTCGVIPARFRDHQERQQLDHLLKQREIHLSSPGQRKLRRPRPALGRALLIALLLAIVAGGHVAYTLVGERIRAQEMGDEVGGVLSEIRYKPTKDLQEAIAGIVRQHGFDVEPETIKIEVLGTADNTLAERLVEGAMNTSIRDVWVTADFVYQGKVYWLSRAHPLHRQQLVRVEIDDPREGQIRWSEGALKDHLKQGMGLDRR
jgi:hypothetical protein